MCYHCVALHKASRTGICHFRKGYTATIGALVNSRPQECRRSISCTWQVHKSTFSCTVINGSICSLRHTVNVQIFLTVIHWIPAITRRNWTEQSTAHTTSKPNVARIAVNQKCANPTTYVVWAHLFPLQWLVSTTCQTHRIGLNNGFFNPLRFDRASNFVQTHAVNRANRTFNGTMLVFFFVFYFTNL